MARRSRSRNGSPKNATSEPDQPGELIVGKHGVYLVQGDRKLKSVRLIPWEQLLSSLLPKPESGPA